MSSDPLGLLTPPRRRRVPTRLVAAIAGALALGVAGTLLGLRLLAADTVAVRGQVHLVGANNVTLTSIDCRGAGPAADLREGAEVVITDADGTTVGVTALRRGTAQTPGFGTPDCTLAFSTSVPAGRDFYGVAIAGRPRVQVPEAQLGTVKLEIGR